MTQRDAVDVAADALIDEYGPAEWQPFDAMNKLRDAIAEALRSASNSGAEAITIKVWVVRADDHDYDAMSQWFVGVYTSQEEAEKASKADEERYVREGGRRAQYNAEIAEFDLPLPAPGAPASPWRVKPLVWEECWTGEDNDIPVWRARNPLGLHVGFSFAGHQINGRRIDRHSDAPAAEVEAEKAKALARYEARIRSAIEPDLPTPPTSKDT